MIGYIRVSTREQASEGYSLAAQEYRLKAFCIAHDYVLVGVEVDAGLSGSNMNRPGLQRALRALEAGSADGIVVTKLDRLTRSVKDFNHMVEKYFQKTYRLASMGDNIDTSTASGRLVLNVLLSVFQWERESIVERIVEGLAQAKREGVVPGPKPMSGPVVARVQELRGLSLRKIAAQLDAEGFKTAKGGRWTAESVRQIAGRVQ